MLDVEKNLNEAIEELRNKFDHFVRGNTGWTRADDRVIEAEKGQLRSCKYRSSDPPHMKDCKQCMQDAGQQDIRNGIIRLYTGSKNRYIPARYYKKADYESLPIRRNIECGWPYTARRYNGAGINYYHYQVRVLKNVLLL